MNLLYLSNALIPSRQANSIHIMKICSAFSEVGFNVALVFSKNNENKISGTDNIFLNFMEQK